MPYRRPDSPIWYVSLTGSSGKRVRRSTGTEDRREAEALEAKWRLETYKERQWGEKPPLSFEECAVLYLKQRGSTRERYAIKALRTFFAGQSMNALSPASVSAYKSSRLDSGVGELTVNRELITFRAMLRFANHEHGYQLPNPVSGRMFSVDDKRVRWITKEEAERLLDACRKSRTEYLHDFVLTALHTGARKNELLGLEWDRVDLANGLIYLEAQHTKTGKRRSIPMSATVRQIMTARKPDGGRYVFGGEKVKDIYWSFNAAVARAGIDDFTIHDLRHTCAAWLVTSGVQLSAVRDLLGHSSVVVTERYAHLCPESVRAAVSVLD